MTAIQADDISCREVCILGLSGDPELAWDPGAAGGSAAVLTMGGGQGAQQPVSSSEMGD